MRRALILLLALLAAQPLWAEPQRPRPRPVADPIPVTRWDFRPEGEDWSRASLTALKSHGRRLVDYTPRDVRRWCPGYPRASGTERRAFWVGFLSALAKYESTWKPRAVGGGGLWYGLLQILPSTARQYGCAAGTGEALKDGAANLSCAIRIMARTVPRDGVIHARQPRWSGVSADWGPMRSAEKRQDMRRWLRSQEYCQIGVSPRPQPRPAPRTLVSGPYRAPLVPLQRPEAGLRGGRAQASNLAETSDARDDDDVLGDDPGRPAPVSGGQ